MNSTDFPSARWFKSSRCLGATDCVEVAFLPGGVAVRDSKDPGPAFGLSTRQWAAFTDACLRSPR
ncbi:DUF397 domain-containing protein [Amycolatopsis xylanica]|uniref:DUF397 domain-containing protein n=1 Tax=Amycolatopsis xylanica TaxID=589385 RepID=UPI000B886340|nr:DUF397 domain-containing protein [Amycolatopsis xylanica]